MHTLSRFIYDESGATTIEYGLIAALIAVGIVAVATTFGNGVSNSIFGDASAGTTK